MKQQTICVYICFMFTLIFTAPIGSECTLAYLEIRKGGIPWYISGVHFQKCSKYSIFFTLNFSTIFFISKVGGESEMGRRKSP